MELEPDEFNPTEQYAKRDHMAMDRAGGYFYRHMSAMTGEGLHNKSHIAGELGWRDMEIDRLKKQVERFELLFESATLARHEAEKQVTEMKALRGKPMDRNTMRDIFVNYGFTVKEGQTDLKEYVFAAGKAIEQYHQIY